jgi:hypothetical protein
MIGVSGLLVAPNDEDPTLWNLRLDPPLPLATLNASGNCRFLDCLRKLDGVGRSLSLGKVDSLPLHKH